jgi:hypothetical protein
VSQVTVQVPCYGYCLKRRLDIPGCKRTYQAWSVCELLLEEEPAALSAHPSVSPAPSAGAAGELSKRVEEAVADVVAGRVVEMVWKTSDLPEGQVAGLIADLPDAIRTLAVKPLESLADSAGAPAPMASVGADAAATLVLMPVLEPAENAVHGLEVAGLMIGMVTGMHWLATTCIQHLAHDDLTSAVVGAVKQMVSHVNAQALDGQPSGARGAVAGPAASGSAESPEGWAAAGHETAEPQRPSLPTVSATGSLGTASTMEAGNAKIPPANAELLLRARGMPDSPATPKRVAKDILLSTVEPDEPPPAVTPLSDLNQGLSSLG